ncbi:MAG: hypothetical protein QXS27_03040 [Candidatus Jordarchaeaceae archaeon]
MNIKRIYEKELMKKANVVGVMIGYKVKGGKKTDKLSIVCLVEKKVPETELKKEDIIPPKIEGVPTDVIQVGKLRALNVDKKAKNRPCPMGTSGGHYLITAGTNGELLKDRETGKYCIGTNNHVGANSNNAQIGDPYLQPGPYDGGTVQNDTIGRLLKFVPINFFGEVPSFCLFSRLWGGTYNALASALRRKTRMKAVVQQLVYNLVDAAMIEVKREDVIPEIVDIGVPKGIRQAEIDMQVQKSGRTTCHTSGGVVIGVGATVGPVYYGTDKSAFFTNQIVIEREGFSAGGDSGSLVLDMDGYAVGKLFAGSEKVTIANNIYDYLDLLNAELVLEGDHTL